MVEQTGKERALRQGSPVAKTCLGRSLGPSCGGRSSVPLKGLREESPNVGQQQDWENQEWRLRTQGRGCTHGGLGPCGPSGPPAPLQEAGLSPRESSQAEPIHGPQAETTPVTN